MVRQQNSRNRSNGPVSQATAASNPIFQPQNGNGNIQTDTNVATQTQEANGDESDDETVIAPSSVETLIFDKRTQRSSGKLYQCGIEALQMSDGELLLRINESKRMIPLSVWADFLNGLLSDPRGVAEALFADAAQMIKDKRAGNVVPKMPPRQSAENADQTAKGPAKKAQQRLES